jgi:hypothetical protein
MLVEDILEQIEGGQLNLTHLTLESKRRFLLDIDGTRYYADTLESINKNSLKLSYLSGPSYRLPVMPRTRFQVIVYEGENRAAFYVYASRVNRSTAKIGANDWESIELYDVSVGAVQD